MNKNNNTSLINKGVFALAVVGITGVVGAANFAQAATNRNSTGYGNSGQAVSALAKAFHAQNQGNGREFSILVRQIQATYKDDNGNSVKMASNKAPADFETKFSTATATYEAANAAALDDFLVSVDGLASTAESKDQFVDKFNNSKAKYFNDLDVAKNTFSDTVNRAGVNTGKDKFMNNYNKARDNYGNKLEVSKNEFANAISNL